jgi:hypothetical protein
VDGIVLRDFEQGEIGPDLFRHACLMGLEGMVSKHRESKLSRRPVPALDQGQEPAISGVQPGDGSVLVLAAPASRALSPRIGARASGPGEEIFSQSCHERGATDTERTKVCTLLKQVCTALMPVGRGTPKQFRARFFPE